MEDVDNVLYRLVYRRVVLVVAKQRLFITKHLLNAVHALQIVIYALMGALVKHVQQALN